MFSPCMLQEMYFGLQLLCWSVVPLAPLLCLLFAICDTGARASSCWDAVHCRTLMWEDQLKGRKDRARTKHFIAHKVVTCRKKNNKNARVMAIVPSAQAYLPCAADKVMEYSQEIDDGSRQIRQIFVRAHNCCDNYFRMLSLRCFPCTF